MTMQSTHVGAMPRATGLRNHGARMYRTDESARRNRGLFGSLAYVLFPALAAGAAVVVLNMLYQNVAPLF